MENKVIQKTLTFGAVVLLLLSMSSTSVLAATPEQKIKELVEKGYVAGYADGTIGENHSITRAEFAAIAVRAMGLEDAAEQMKNMPSGFFDVNAGDWYNGAVAVARSNKLISGYPGGAFKPNETISYGEALTVLARMRLTPDKQALVDRSGQWPNNYYAEAAKLKLLEDVPGVSVNEKANRGNIFLVLSNVVKLNEAGDEDVVTPPVITTENAKAIAMEKTETAFKLVVLENGTSLVKGDILTVPLSQDLTLGKVYDLKVAKNKTVTSNEENKDAVIKTGAITKERKNLVIEKKKYAVDASVKLMHNGEEVQITKFPFSAEHSSATFFNDKLVYVAAYSFNETLPIKEVKNSRIYGITKEGYERTLVSNSYTDIYLLDNGITSEITVEDIEAGDMAYITRSGMDTVIYITKNTVAGEVTALNVANNTITINGVAYGIEKGNFPTLMIQEKRHMPVVNVERLENLKGSEVEVTINLNGKIQIIRPSENVSVYARAIVQSIGYDTISVTTEDGFRDTLKITEYTNLIEETPSGIMRDNTFNRYYVQRLMTLINQGNVVKVVFDGNGEVEEIEILKGKGALVTGMDYDVVEMGLAYEYLSRDVLVLKVVDGNYVKVETDEFIDTFFRHRDAQASVTLFKTNEEVEVIILLDLEIEALDTLLATVTEANAVWAKANSYLETVELRRAKLSLVYLIEDIQANVDELYEEDVVILQRDLDLALVELRALTLTAAKEQFALQIAQAEALVEANYTVGTWATFKTALDNAKVVAATVTATQIAIDNASLALSTARTSLIPLPNKTALVTKIAEAELLVEANYTPATWTILNTALTSAKTVQANAEASQVMVDAALQALTTAVTGLVVV